MSTVPRAHLKLTAHQFDVLRIIILGNATDDPTLALVDLDEVLGRVDKKTTKPAMQFTIRALVGADMIEKVGRVERRGRLRVTFKPTVLGREIGEDTPVRPAFIEPDLGVDLGEMLSGI